MTNQQPTVVGGRYELGELLGRGGMAEVRKGVDTRLGRVVAVKRLRTDLASDPTFQARFRREAQSSASLNHPAIVAVYDTGEEMTPDGIAQPYIVMEYVAGRTLRDILREGRKILPERALEITSGVLSALDYSHRAGIIHRDIKPANVMLTPNGDVKVMDFGIARAVSDASSTMTQTAAVVGTAQYLSPEQARGETVDSRSDVYSTGCLLYELLTGRPPFVGESPVAVAYQHVREPAVPPSSHDAELPHEIDAIAMKSLAKRVEERYQSAAAMRADIERYLAGRPVQAPAVAVPVGVPAAAATAHLPEHTAVLGATAAGPPPHRQEPEEERRSKAGIWALVLLLLLAILGAAIWLVPKLMDEQAPQQVSVPSVVGSKQAVATRTLEGEGLEAEVTRRADPEAPRGQVISQDPDSGTLVDVGATIRLVVSTGPPTESVPRVVGMDVDDARAALRELNFEVKVLERNSDEPAGRVVEQSPSSGTTYAEGRTVTLYVSDGPEEVPDVVGLKQGAAERAIRDAGFEPVVRTSTDTEEPKGTVIEQFPEAGEELEQEGKVQIVVSAYEPEPTPSPTPTPTPTPTTDPSPTATTEPSPTPGGAAGDGLLTP
jgi:beta-lactam-binding protein with PASTA domain/predicted Ser/Thr protein kinase